MSRCGMMAGGGMYLPQAERKRGLGGGAMPPGSEAMPPGEYPGGGYAGSGGASGATAGASQLPGGKGPVFKKAEKQATKVIDRTDFVVQFIWIPTVERDRKDADPRAPVSAGTEGAAAHCRRWLPLMPQLPRQRRPD